ncbi:MAG: tetratricopeptide repeat protein [Gammaproteobacteria bacterium]|jgi:predicted Zn-dependent protease
MKFSACFPACLATILSIQGCTGTPAARPPPVVEQGRPATEPLPLPDGGEYTRQAVPAPAVTGQSPAVVALLDTAEQQANAGNLESAAASLERAIRIDSRNPVLWYHLATVRLAQDRPVQAEQLAIKSNSLAAGSLLQQVRNWQLIARARRARNNATGAAAAEQQARALESRLGPRR